MKNSNIINSVFSNVVQILKRRNTPCVTDILYLKKTYPVLATINILKPQQSGRLGALCDTKITPKMCLDEVHRLNMFLPGSAPFADRCLLLQKDKAYSVGTEVPAYTLNYFTKFLSESKPFSYNDNLLIYNMLEQIEFGKKDLSIWEFLNLPHDIYTDGNSYPLCTLVNAPKDVLSIKYKGGKRRVRLLSEVVYAI